MAAGIVRRIRGPRPPPGRRSARISHPAAVRRRRDAAGRHAGDLRHLLPGPEAGPARDPALLYVGKHADPRPSRASGRSWASTSRSSSSTGTSSRASFVGPRLRQRPRRHPLRRALLRLLLQDRAGGLAAAAPTRSRSPSRSPLGAAVLWLVVGVATGVVSALQAGHALRPRRDGRRARRRLAADLLHRPARRCRSSSTSWTGSTAQLRAVHREPGRVGQRPVPAVGHARLPLRRDLRPAHPRQHAGDHGRGLHPHRPRQGPAGAHGHRQARPARRAHPDRHHLRHGLRRCCSAARSSPRPCSPCTASAQYAVQAISDNDLPIDPGRDPARRVLRRRRQPPGGPAVRRRSTRG